MTPLLWHRFVRDAREAHTALMAVGRVIMPQMCLLVGGDIIGRVVLRPILTGSDAVIGVAEMSHLAAAVSADEIVALWEARDLDRACGGEIPTEPRGELDIVTATPDGHVLFRYPYNEVLLAGRSSDGLLTARPQWLLPSLGEPDAELPPAIDALVEFCWRPLDIDVPNPNLLDYTVGYLRTEGYAIDLLRHP